VKKILLLVLGLNLFFFANAQKTKQNDAETLVKGTKSLKVSKQILFIQLKINNRKVRKNK
jgi:hypothetical protein